MDQNMQNQGRNICYCRRCRGIVHQVKRGDTLYAMSRNYGVPVGEIISANPFINIYNLRIGQEICIPIRTPQPRTGMMNTRGMAENDFDENMNNAGGNNNNRNQMMNNGMEARSEFMETEEVEPCCQSHIEPEEEYSESSHEEMQQMSRDDMVLTGEEKLSDVLAQYDMDIEDFIKCIRKEK